MNKQLTTVALALLDNQNAREIEICLSNGTRIKAYGSDGGYVQYGIGAGVMGTEEWRLYSLTQPIAQRWATWLNGGKRPKPSTRYTEFTDLHAYEAVAIHASREPLPTLDQWKCYYFNGKQNCYDITRDEVRYSIMPVMSNVSGRLLGYALSQFTQQDGHQQILADGTVGSYVPHGNFSRAASAARVAAQVHTKRLVLVH